MKYKLIRIRIANYKQLMKLQSQQVKISCTHLTKLSKISNKIWLVGRAAESHGNWEVINGQYREKKLVKYSHNCQILRVIFKKEII